jgi:hypothetical protein
MQASASAGQPARRAQRRPFHSRVAPLRGKHSGGTAGFAGRTWDFGVSVNANGSSASDVGVEISDSASYALDACRRLATDGSKVHMPMRVDTVRRAARPFPARHESGARVDGRAALQLRRKGGDGDVGVEDVVWRFGVSD